MDNSKLFSDIRKVYQINALDLDKAVNVWLDNNLDSEDIKTIIYADCGYKVDENFVDYLVRRSFSINQKRGVNVEDSVNKYKLSNANIVRLTPSIRKEIVATGRNTFMTRYGSPSVEWSIIMIDNVPHLARKDLKNSENKYSQSELNERNSDKNH